MEYSSTKIGKIYERVTAFYDDEQELRSFGKTIPAGRFASCRPFGSDKCLFTADNTGSESTNTVYLVGEHFSDVNVFSIQAYHWTAPYSNPLDAANAVFFLEGQKIGSSNDGFEKLLRRIAHDRPRQIFILGSLFDMGRSFPPNPSPYERQQGRLNEVLRTTGTDLIMLDIFP